MASTQAVGVIQQRLGRLGVWLNPAVVAASRAETQRRQLSRIESLGYGSVWTGESPGARDVFVTLGIWLAATDTITVGSGIANIWARPASTTRSTSDALADAYPDRFILGLGVGVPRQATAMGHDYGSPLARARQYLDQLDQHADPARPRPPRLLAAIGRKMLALAAKRTDGAHTFGTPVQTTRLAREVLGPDKLLIAEQAILIDNDRARAREHLRAYRLGYLRLLQNAGLGIHDSPYNRNLIRLGFTAEEIRVSSDRVLDAVTAYGDTTTVANRIRQHLDAGADHVVLNPHGDDLPTQVDQLEHLAATCLA